MPTLWQHLRVRDLSYFKAAWFSDPTRRRGRVLDLPSGHGEDSARLHALGYEVVPADLFPECFAPELPGVACVRADMEARLPFDDSSFDAVLNSEGIEHLADQLAFLRECARVLKPGGTLFLTTPNLLSLRARLAFALTGQRAFRSFVDEVTSVWGTDGERVYHGHAFLINYFQLRYMLHHAGFAVREVVRARYSLTSVLLLPFAPLVAWFTARAMRGAQRKNPGSPIYADIRRHVCSQAMLLSGNLFLVAERLPTAERAPTEAVPHHARRLERAMLRSDAASG